MPLKCPSLLYEEASAAEIRGRGGSLRDSSDVFSQSIAQRSRKLDVSRSNRLACPCIPLRFKGSGPLSAVRAQTSGVPETSSPY